MSCKKIAPRDVFNTANFLKCIARIVSWIEKGEISNIAFTPTEINEDWVDFNIDESSGDFIPNKPLFYKVSNGEPINLIRNLNARSAWPVYIVTDDWEEFDIFDIDGDPSAELLTYLGQGETSEHNLSQAIFDQAMLMKCIAKLSLLCVVDEKFDFLAFDEDYYSANNIQFEKDGQYITPTKNFFTLKGEPLYITRTTGTNEDWLMTVWDEANSTYIKVYDEAAELSSQFLSYIGEVESD